MLFKTGHGEFPDLSGTPFSHITPQWAWGEGEGAGIRVAVIDSGVDADHPALEGSVRGGVEIRQQGEKVEMIPGLHSDAFGHGTACAGIIHQIAPGAEIYSIKVLGRALSGAGSIFLAGLKWAVEQNIPLINLSLGTTRDHLFAPLHHIVDQGYFNRVLMVAAQNNSPTPSFPSVFSSIIGVKAVLTEDPFTFYFSGSPPVEFLARGVNVRLPWLNHSYEVCTGNSFAAPHITGIIARILSKHPHLPPFMIKTVLYSLALRNGEYKRGTRSGG